MARSLIDFFAINNTMVGRISFCELGSSVTETMLSSLTIACGGCYPAF
jgi:hypothetical protein